MDIVSRIKKDLRVYATTERKKTNEWFFKTGKGEYGEGDMFLGVRVPDIRKVVKTHAGRVKIKDIKRLINDPVHEVRLCALLFLVDMYKRGGEGEKRKYVTFYLTPHIRTRINNWDLVDASAPYITGDYFIHKDKKKLYKLLTSKSLWDRRIAVVSTWGFIRNGYVDDTYKMAETLLSDKEDLMHKAVGWMLREAGKKDEKKLLQFLETYAHRMPRTMLRYSIEKLSDKKRKYFMNKK